MKKITLVALFCALFMVPTVKAQEVTYVEDPSQGYLLNKFQDNWFVSAEGGVGAMFSQMDSKYGFGKRIMPTFNLSVGKWFSPIIGLRLGVNGQKYKGLTNKYGIGIAPTNPEMKDGYYQQKFWGFGPTADVLLNLTNWWCGYRPGRIYNAVVYGGFQANCIMTKQKDGNDQKWKYDKTFFGAHVGLLNTFAISQQVDFLLDVRADLNQGAIDQSRSFFGNVAVMGGFAYKFKKREWKAPVTAVCPEYKYTDAEGDALVARLQAADSKIASLEEQLKACLNRPQPKAATISNAPIATVYFPIGSSRVATNYNGVLKAVASAMKASGDEYTLTGWADNYTGSAKRNDNLRSTRAKSVAKILTKHGVAKAKLNVTTDNQNLTNLGSKSASLDRAVTINGK